MSQSQTYVVTGGTSYHQETSGAVRMELEWARTNKKLIRIWYGDTDTGRAWMEEHDVLGYVGRSTGPIKIPLLLAKRTSDGGGAILDHCIVRIDDVNGERTMYKHPRYDNPADRAVIVAGGGADASGEEGGPEHEHGGLRGQIFIDGENEANFCTRESAEQWIAFMRGESYVSPVCD